MATRDPFDSYAATNGYFQRTAWRQALAAAGITDTQPAAIRAAVALKGSSASSLDPVFAALGDSRTSNTFEDAINELVADINTMRDLLNELAAGLASRPPGTTAGAATTECLQAGNDVFSQLQTLFSNCGDTPPPDPTVQAIALSMAAISANLGAARVDCDAALDLLVDVVNPSTLWGLAASLESNATVVLGSANAACDVLDPGRGAAAYIGKCIDEVEAQAATLEPAGDLRAWLATQAAYKAAFPTHATQSLDEVGTSLATGAWT